MNWCAYTGTFKKAVNDIKYYVPIPRFVIFIYILLPCLQSKLWFRNLISVLLNIGLNKVK